MNHRRIIASVLALTLVLGMSLSQTGAADVRQNIQTSDFTPSSLGTDVVAESSSRAILFSETTTGDVSVESLWEFNSWDGVTGFEVVNTTSVANLIASEGDNVTKISPDIAGGWWGGGLVVNTGVDVSGYGGSMIFDINTAYDSSFELGFQTSTADGTTTDHRYEVTNGVDYTNDSYWQTVVVPITSFGNGGSANLANVTFVMMFNQGTMGLDDAPIYLDNIYWSSYAPDIKDKAVVFSETTTGDVSIESLWEFNSWDGVTGFEEINATADSSATASEGDNVTKISPDIAGGWWGGGLLVNAGVDVSGYGGSMVFDLNTTYATSFELGFQTSTADGTTTDHKYEVTNGVDYVNDSTWQTLMIPISSFTGGQPNLSNVTFVMMFNQGGVLDDGVIYLDNIYWSSYVPVGNDVAVVFSETTQGNATVQSLVDYEIWDGESGIEVINTTGVDGLTASEGENVTKITPVLNSGWWGGGLIVRTGVNVSDFDGFLVFDILTNYNTSFEFGFQTSNATGDTTDHRYEVTNGADYVNDSRWQTVYLPLNYFSGGAQDLGNVTFVLMFNQGTMGLDDAPIYLDNILWVSAATPTPAPVEEPVDDTPAEPDYIYDGSSNAVVYSETTSGEQIVGTQYQWNTNGDQMSLSTVDDASEGSEAFLISAFSPSPFWGTGFGNADEKNYDLSAFAGGYLIFDMKSDYTGIFSVGYQEGLFPDNTDAFLTLTPGEYGYDNDDTWRTVVIPVADVMAVSDADLGLASSVFVIFDDTVANDGEIGTGDIYFDNVYYKVDGAGLPDSGVITGLTSTTDTSDTTDSTSTTTSTTESSTPVSTSTTETEDASLSLPMVMLIPIALIPIIQRSRRT